MKRKSHTPDEKAYLVIEVLRGERTMNEIAINHKAVLHHMREGIQAVYPHEKTST